MDRLNYVNFGAAYLVLVAVGAVVGGTVAAVRCIATWARGRRT